MTPGRRLEVRGIVQGVGYRPWVYRVARETGITGRVWNHARGVTIEAFGDRLRLARFEARVRQDGPPASRVEEVQTYVLEAPAVPDFTIVPSQHGSSVRASIPPDLATCDDCLKEVFNPSDRRYRYAFTNCTNCGPRYTIALDVPYDRPATTMAAFEMCVDCRDEYEDPNDRRFHAQPNACPVCGPQLRFVGDESEFEDPLEAAVAALKQGQIVAVKGLGGYHLACDALDEAVVQRLRQRKHREEKPFAVMVRDLVAAAHFARLTSADEDLLSSPARPIVLLPGRVEHPLAPSVAPDTPRVGLMLPYTPLHHLLLAGVEGPLVMTSANRASEPIVHRDEAAFDRLENIADAFLTHDRPIAAPTDDSIAAVIAGSPMVMRRSRGWVPQGIKVKTPFERPTLACGAQLKSAICLGVEDTAWLGPHVGDLDELRTWEAWLQSVDRLTRFLEVEPEILAHDLHPDYLSTHYAHKQEAMTVVGVQHHHAHVVTCMAEHGVESPVFGLAWDGTGYGPDHNAWGGELLLADRSAYTRLGTFVPLRLPGGDRAIKEPWRILVAALDAAGAGDALPRLLPDLDPLAIEGVRSMVAADLNCPLAHGVGRWFDVMAVLTLGRTHANYEGQLPMALEQAASGGQAAALSVHISKAGGLWMVDPTPALLEAVAWRLAGRDPGVLARRWHATLVDAATRLLGQVTREHGPHPVALTGGVFQNGRLARGLASRLHIMRIDPLLHRDTPAGDGGLALGQAVIASANKAHGPRIELDERRR